MKLKEAVMAIADQENTIHDENNFRYIRSRVFIIAVAA